MGEVFRPLVAKVMEYVVINPEFRSLYNNVDEMNKDWTLINQLGSVFNILNQICSNLDDTLLEVGAEVLDQANKYYGQSHSLGTEIWLQFKLFNPLKTRSNRLGLF